MLKNKRILLLLIATLLSNACWSGDFYIGLGIGPEVATFKQTAYIVQPANFSTVEDTTFGGNGFFSSIFAGYSVDLSEFHPCLNNAALTLEVNANKSSVKYKNTNSELIHANFNNAYYKLNRNFGISILPEYYFGECTLIYARLGYIKGNFKIATTEITLPNLNKNLDGFRYGLGIKQFLNDCFSIRFECSHIAYKQVTRLGFDASSATTKKTYITPGTNMAEIGLAYHF